MPQASEERKARERARYHAKKATMTAEELAAFRQRHAESRRRYYANHTEEVKAKAREHWAKPKIRARELARQQARWQADPDFWRAYGRAARVRNLATHKAAQKRWIEKNRAKTVLAVAKRRARKRGSPRNDLTQQQWRTIQAAQGHRCAYCGKRCKGKLTRDHISPLGPTGPHTLHNIVAACRSCNSRKGKRAVLKPVQPLLL